jgi:hypothetical protein
MLQVISDWWMGLSPSTLAQWVGAVATSAAVVVALFKDQIFRYWRRPKLGIRISPEPPDTVFSPMGVSDDQGKLQWWKSYWLRLWVENHGKDRAEQVQVFVSKVSKRGANDKYDSIRDFVPMNLRWSNGRDWRNPEIFAPGISPTPLGKHCDFCSISDPENPQDELPGYKGQCVATLQLEVFPSANRHRLPPGDYILEVIVGAANAEAKITHVRLNLKGQWSPDPKVMLKDYLGIEIVSGPFGQS